MNATIELKRARNDRFLFDLKAANGEIIFTSGLYATKETANEGINAFKAAAPFDSMFERKVAKDDSPYFVLKAANGEILGKSEMYSSNTSMERGIKSVMRNAATAELKDVTTAETVPLTR